MWFHFTTLNKLIYSTVIPPPPQNLTITDSGHSSLYVSWNAQDDVDSYIVSINTTNKTQQVNTTWTSLDTQYKLPLLVAVRAVNCAGRSNITETVFVGKNLGSEAFNMPQE